MSDAQEDGDWVFSEVGRTYNPPRHGLGWHTEGGCTVHMQMMWVPRNATYCFWLGKAGETRPEGTPATPYAHTGDAYIPHGAEIKPR